DQYPSQCSHDSPFLIQPEPGGRRQTAPSGHLDSPNSVVPAEVPTDRNASHPKPCGPSSVDPSSHATLPPREMPSPGPRRYVALPSIRTSCWTTPRDREAAPLTSKASCLTGERVLPRPRLSRWLTAPLMRSALGLARKVRRFVQETDRLARAYRSPRPPVG